MSKRLTKEKSAKARELDYTLGAVAQEARNLEKNDTWAASMQGRRLMPLAKGISQHDHLNEVEAKGEHEAGEEKMEGKENEDDVKKPQGQAVDKNVYDPMKIQYEPLAYKSRVIFGIETQAVVNVLSDMDPLGMSKAVCGAIKKKQTCKRTFLGTSYLSEVSLLDSGNISAITNNENWEDVLLLS